MMANDIHNYNRNAIRRQTAWTIVAGGNALGLKDELFLCPPWAIR